MAGSFRTRSSEFPLRKLHKVRFIGIVEKGLQIAESWRERIESVIGDGDGLGILKLHECLHIEPEIGVGVVALGRSNVGAMRNRVRRKNAHPSIVAAFGKVVANLEFVLAAAELRGCPRRKVI